MRNIQTLCKIYLRFYKNVGYHSSDKTAFIQWYSLREKDEGYSFEGEVEDYLKWTSEGADVNVWDLSPLEVDIANVTKITYFFYDVIDGEKGLENIINETMEIISSL